MAQIPRVLGNAGGGSFLGTVDHDKLFNRGKLDSHPMSAITGLREALKAEMYRGVFLTPEALIEAHATDEAGAYATVMSGTTQTIYAWDPDTLAWVDTGISGVYVESVDGQTGPNVITDPAQNGAEMTVNKGVPNGYAPLDEQGVIPEEHLPDSLTITFDHNRSFNRDEPHQHALSAIDGYLADEALSDTIARIETEHAQLNAEMTTMENNFTVHETVINGQIAGMQEDIDDAQSELDTAEGRIDGLNDNITSINTNMSGVQNTLLNIINSLTDGSGGGTLRHDALLNRDLDDQHPISAISGLEQSLVALQYQGVYDDIADIPTDPAPQLGDYVTIVQGDGTTKMYYWNGTAWVDSGVAGPWVEAVNGKPGPNVILSPSDLGAESITNKGVPGGYAALDSTGKIPAESLPAGAGGGGTTLHNELGNRDLSNQHPASAIGGVGGATLLDTLNTINTNVTNTQNDVNSLEASTTNLTNTVNNIVAEGGVGTPYIKYTEGNLSSSIGGTTSISRSAPSLASASFVVAKTLVSDALGTIAVYTDDSDASNYIVSTICISSNGVGSIPDLLGNVATNADRPADITAATTLFGKTPEVGDWLNVLADETMDGALVRWYLTAIDGTTGAITYGTPLVLNTSNYQAQTAGTDAGKVPTIGATAGTWGTPRNITDTATSGSQDLMTSGGVFDAMSSGGGGGGAFQNVVFLTTSGTWTVPKTGKYKITLIGGGGGGGKGTASNNACGGGGGGGGVLVTYIDYIAGTVIPYVIGAGGNFAYDTLAQGGGSTGSSSISWVGGGGGGGNFNSTLCGGGGGGGGFDGANSPGGNALAGGIGGIGGGANQRYGLGGQANINMGQPGGDGKNSTGGQGGFAGASGSGGMSFFEQGINGQVHYGRGGIGRVGASNGTNNNAGQQGCIIIEW